MTLVGGGIRGPQTATPGGSVTINVGTNDPTVQFVDANTGEVLGSVDVEPDKDTTITLPTLPGGSVLQLIVGKGVDTQVLPIEIISPAP